jgi:DNA end-binding protein Ku
MLDKRDLSPIHFQRVNATTGKKIDYDDIVKGYKTKDGDYVVLSDADFRRANVDATQTVDIVDFVDAREIDPLYYDKPYYLGPVAMRKGRTADSKAYTLLRETLRRTGKVGIAKVVIRTREHLAALMPVGDVLALNLLRFDHEVRNPSSIEAPSGGKAASVSPREIKMAEQLVSELSGAWDPKKYKDEYRDDLLELIRKKEKSGQAHVVDESEPEAPAAHDDEGVDMLSLLCSGRASRRRATARSRGRPTRTPRAARLNRAAGRDRAGRPSARRRRTRPPAGRRSHGPLDLLAEARFREDSGAEREALDKEGDPRARQHESRERSRLCHPEARGDEAPLRFPARARRRAQELGRAEGAEPRS